MTSSRHLSIDVSERPEPKHHKGWVPGVKSWTRITEFAGKSREFNEGYIRGAIGDCFDSHYQDVWVRVLPEYVDVLHEHGEYLGRVTYVLPEEEMWEGGHVLSDEVGYVTVVFCGHEWVEPEA